MHSEVKAELADIFKSAQPAENDKEHLITQRSIARNTGVTIVASHSNVTILREDAREKKV